MTMKNFTPAVKKETIKFQVDDDVFEAAAEIGAGMLQDVVLGSSEGLDADVLKAAASGDTAQILELGPDKIKQVVDVQRTSTARVMDFLDAVLLPESALRFSQRMRSATEPITLPQTIEIYRWLIAEYSGRPTAPSSSSSGGLDGSGQSSTDGQQLVESIPSS